MFNSSKIILGNNSFILKLNINHFLDTLFLNFIYLDLLKTINEFNSNKPTSILINTNTGIIQPSKSSKTYF